MKTVIVELRNHNALNLLKELELANIIRIVPKEKKNTPKLSERLKGAISPERAEELNKQLEEMRDEWTYRNA